LPYAFASHFAPAALEQACAVYRAQFKPSEQLDKPYLMLGVPVIAADSNEEAQLLQSSGFQAFVSLRRGQPIPLPPPDGHYAAQLRPEERAMLDQIMSCAIVGSADTVRRGLDSFVARTGADELIVTAQIFDHAARLRSFEITAEVAGLGSSPRSAAGA
jgi:luciferase family oxidoreductase group 1